MTAHRARLEPDAVDAVFFDLDDTLLDTAGRIVRPALAAAAGAMVAAGFPASTEELVAFLHRQADAADGRDYFARAADRFDVNEKDRERLIETGRRAYLSSEVPDLELFPESEPLLVELARRHRLFLVTGGHANTQRGKIARLGLERLFHDVVVVDTVGGDDKTDAFRQLLTRHGLEPSRCVCVGDRIAGEIRDANRLGMLTVRLRQGEFAAVEPGGPDEEPDHVVEDLAELSRLLGGDPEDSSP